MVERIEKLRNRVKAMSRIRIGEAEWEVCYRLTRRGYLKPFAYKALLPGNTFFCVYRDRVPTHVIRNLNLPHSIRSH
jgi:hypothetical protein